MEDQVRKVGTSEILTLKKVSCIMRCSSDGIENLPMHHGYDAEVPGDGNISRGTEAAHPSQTRQARNKQEYKG